MWQRTCNIASSANVASKALFICSAKADEEFTDPKDHPQGIAIVCSLLCNHIQMDVSQTAAQTVMRYIYCIKMSKMYVLMGPLWVLLFFVGGLKEHQSACIGMYVGMWMGVSCCYLETSIYKSIHIYITINTKSLKAWHSTDGPILANTL